MRIDLSRFWRFWRFWMVLVVTAAAACSSSGAASGDDVVGDDDPGDDPTVPDAAPGDDLAPDASSPSPDAPGGGGGAAHGSACSCDADCAGDATNPGACIYGICMTMASEGCSAAGSQAECPDGSRCWNLTGFDGGSICWPDCDAHTCAGSCDGDGSCVPAADDDCDPTCGAACSCTETSCPDGEVCVNGACVADAGDGPGPGPGPSCPSLPARDCTGTTCGQLVVFDPRSNAAWDDYPINGETAQNQYRSYLRRDLAMLVGYATSKVACKTAAWEAGNGGPLGLGDMSEANGAIPGTSIGQPGHPQNTHTNGYDIDLAYYQAGTVDNRLRPICAHTSGGQDQYHCVAEPDKLDVWRTALFLGAVFESSRVRVIGVDGKAGPMLMSALDTLCDTGWVTPDACANIVLAYEETNQNLGWYYFHHHHAHISLKQASGVAPVIEDGCFEPGCGAAVKALPGRTPGLHPLR